LHESNPVYLAGTFMVRRRAFTGGWSPRRGNQALLDSIMATISILLKKPLGRHDPSTTVSHILLAEPQYDLSAG